MIPSATLQELAEERASAAEGKVATLEAKLGVAQNERDVAVKTAEANEAITKDLVGRIEDIARDNGRKDGVIEVLNDQIRQNQTIPPAAPVDQQPVLDALRRIEEKVTTSIARPAAGNTGRPNFWQRSARGILVPIIWVIGLIVILFVLFLFWEPVSKGMSDFWTMLTHREEVVNPPVISSEEPPVPSEEPPLVILIVPIEPPPAEDECTVLGTVHVEGIGCVFPVPGE